MPEDATLVGTVGVDSCADWYSDPNRHADRHSDRYADANADRYADRDNDANPH
jgi:hypothetical protein